MSGNGFKLEHERRMCVVRTVRSGDWEYVVFGLVFGPCMTWALQMERDAMLCVFVVSTGRVVAFELRGGKSSTMERRMRCVE